VRHFRWNSGMEIPEPEKPIRLHPGVNAKR
jgi:hypothetical protein